MKKCLFFLLAICIFQLNALNASIVNSSAWGKCTATDGSGNVYVTGYFYSSTITFGTTTLTNAASGYSDIYIVKYDPAGNVVWAISAGGTNSDGGGGVTTDGSGNVYVTGTFGSSSINFGGIILTNVGNTDIFIVKYDPNGNVIWAHSAGGTSHDEVSRAATDGTGNVYLTGNFTSSSITFGAITLVDLNPGNDMFIVKYDATGNVLWAEDLGGSGSQLAWDISTDINGNSYVTGDFTSITFGTTTLTSNGYMDMFIVKYDPNGNVLWATSAGGNYGDIGEGIATDVSGGVYVTGEFASSSITFGGITLTNPGTQYTDMFIVKYDASGTVLWAQRAGGSTYTNDGGHGIATDGSGNAYVTGYFCSSSITFGTITLTNTKSSGDIFTVKYNTSGTVLWAKKAGGSDADNGLVIAADGSGNAYVTGYFSSSTISFGSITLINTNGNNGNNYNDMFLAKYDANGNEVWAKCAGGSPPGHGKPKSADVGVKDPLNDMITIYPNPTSGRVTVSASDSQSAINSISVFNMAGKEVLSPQFTVGTSEVKIDLSAQPKGIYIIRLEAGGNPYLRKIIIR